MNLITTLKNIINNYNNIINTIIIFINNNNKIINNLDNISSSLKNISSSLDNMSNNVYSKKEELNKLYDSLKCNEIFEFSGLDSEYSRKVNGNINLSYETSYDKII